MFDSYLANLITTLRYLKKKIVKNLKKKIPPKESR